MMSRESSRLVLPKVQSFRPPTSTSQKPAFLWSFLCSVGYVVLTDGYEIPVAPKVLTPSNTVSVWMIEYGRPDCHVSAVLRRRFQLGICVLAFSLRTFLWS